MSINVLAPANSLSYGIVSLNLLKGLAKRTRVSWWPIGAVEVEKEDANLLQVMASNTALFDYHAPSLRIFHQFSMAEHVGKGVRAGLPIFELDAFNEVEKHHLRSLDIVFAPTAWAAQVLRLNGVIPNRIRRMSFGVDPAIFNTNGKFEWPTTRFLNVGKWELRKGHDVLIDAFCKAFSPKDNVELWMMPSNPFLDQEELGQWEQLYKSSTMGSKVRIVGRQRDHRAVCGVMASCDCGVFPSRAEGWNLPLSEMMAMGKPVIATHCSAHMEYVSDAVCRVIYVREREPAFDGRWFHGQGEWAKLSADQVDQLVEHMRAVHHEKQNGELRPNDGGAKLFRETLTWERGVDDILQGLDL